MVIDQKNRNSITMEEYSNYWVFQRYKRNKLFQHSKLIKFKLDDKVRRFNLLKELREEPVRE